jgi:hypothetical protein
MLGAAIELQYMHVTAKDHAFARQTLLLQQLDSLLQSSKWYISRHAKVVDGLKRQPMSKGGLQLELSSGYIPLLDFKHVHMPTKLHNRFVDQV